MQRLRAGACSTAGPTLMSWYRAAKSTRPAELQHLLLRQVQHAAVLVLLSQVQDGVMQSLKAEDWPCLQQECTSWTEEGQCNGNPRYMHFGCRKSCGSCFQPDLQVRILLQLADPSLLPTWPLAVGYGIDHETASSTQNALLDVRCWEVH